MSYPVRATLRKDLRRALRSGHPWVYRDAIVSLDAEPGTPVRIVTRDARFVAAGIAESGPIGVRVWTTKDEAINADFIGRRIRQAIRLRKRTLPENCNAYRMVHGEGDRLGGVVCDRYGPYICLQLDGDGPASYRDVIAHALTKACPDVEGIICRTGKGEHRKVEVIYGDVPSGRLNVIENGMKLTVDLHKGQKTGLFLDHRDSRKLVRSMAKDLRVLNLYSYTGGFSVAAGLGGAEHVTSVDISEPAIIEARESWKLNDLDEAKHEGHASDVPEFLKHARIRRKKWDLVIADPPSFAPNEDSKERALSAYRSLHRAALEQTADAGFYLAASCSSHITRDEFEETIIRSASSTRIMVQVLGRWGAPVDHPRPLAFPEGDYLKVLLCRVFE